MPTLPVRAAAYTRTGIVRRFFDHLSESTPSRVDNTYAEGRLALKGGDVRAFLQSMRVLGFVDPYGAVTDRGRRTRAVTQRAAAVREGLEDAYPELVARWDQRGGMSRQEIEDFFKYEYGLSASSAGPAAKLFEDLMREYGRSGSRGQASGARGGYPPATGRPGIEEERSPASGWPPEPPRFKYEPGWEEDSSAPAGREPISSALPAPFGAPQLLNSEHLNTEYRTPERPNTRTPDPGDIRIAALDAIKSAVKIEVTSDWDERKIDLVFDRMERLVKLAIGES